MNYTVRHPLIHVRTGLVSFFLFVMVMFTANAAMAADVEGRVLIAGKPVSGSTVTLFVAGSGTPKQLAQGKTDNKGLFKFHDDHIFADGVYYLIAKGGVTNGSEGLTLLSVLGTRLPKSVTINELTTVASAFTSAQFISGESISGNKLGLKIAAGNAPNLVDPVTGGWGKVVIDPINSTQTETLAKLNTLGSLISAFATVSNNDWRARFLNAATQPGTTTAKNTMEAMADVARTSWVGADALYVLFDEAYPQPKDGARRAAPFAPYLSYTPVDFALSLCFAGGGVYANGRFMFDAEGNLWSGQNWMPGSQSGVIHNIGGGVIKFSPNGTPLSPAITGFTGMGIDGVGWGTAVTKTNVWITSFNGKILVMDFNGKPVASESDFPFKEKLTGLMGIGVSATGDVWIADGSNDQLLFFPGGRIKEGKIVKVAGLKSPFDVVIDDNNNVWVSNSQSNTVIRFPANDPTKTNSYIVGGSVRALALDSRNNVWVASETSHDFPQPNIPDGASIMEQFYLGTIDMFKYVTGPPARNTGAVNMIRPDGTQPAPEGFNNPAISVPWGINVDGNDDVWLGNMWGRSVTLLAGDNTKGHASGTKAGDIIHEFKSGSIQMITDASIDAAGNVWVANNWNLESMAMAKDPYRPTSTWGGGQNFTVIYGVASPVKGPKMGKVKKY